MSFNGIRNLTLFLILSSHLSCTKCEELFNFLKGFNVHIVNGLPDNTHQFFFRCQSGDDDLGYHSLLVGEEYHWKFRINLFGDTLFFCHFYWQNKDKSFDVFNGNIYFPSCDAVKDGYHQCYWLAKDDGFYFCDYMADLKSHDWEKFDSW